MSMLVTIGWCVWAVAAANMGARGFARTLAQSRALDRVLVDKKVAPTLHDLRILANHGDWRDPIERHQDAMTSMTGMASLAFSAMALWFFGSVS